MPYKKHKRSPYVDMSLLRNPAIRAILPIDMISWNQMTMPERAEWITKNGGGWVYAK